MARIMVIEDDEVLRPLLVDLLAAQGHLARSAANGSDGLDKIHEWLPDLVITDIYMPGRDGIEVIMHLRQTLPEIKIIALSGEQLGPFFSTLHVARQLGADGVLEKPFQPMALFALIDQLLDAST